MEINNKKIFFIGIGGISMSALAHFALHFGATVFGSDVKETEQMQKLKSVGAKVFVGHNEKNVTEEIDLIVWTSAIKKDNEELEKARKLGIKTMTRAEFLSEIASRYKNVIAVAGSHGKTTTTAMLFCVMQKAGLCPTLHLGGNLESENTNFVIGNNKYFVTEACEFERNFLQLKPDVSIVTNVDYDHVDTYKTVEEYEQAFEQFATQSGYVVTGDEVFFKCVKNAELLKKIQKISKNCIKINKTSKNGCCVFDLFINKKWYKNIKLNIAGKHNVLNASKVFALCLKLGISQTVIKAGLLEFCGTHRRFEFKGKFNGAKMYIDYAHHPKEIEAMLSLCKYLTKGKIYCVFQSHTYTRTKVLWKEFSSCFYDADEVFIFPIYSAREKAIENVDAEHLAKSVKQNGINCKAVESFEELKNILKNKVKYDDLVVVLGAGDICDFADFLIQT